jgi:hypothetical protein
LLAQAGAPWVVFACRLYLDQGWHLIDAIALATAFLRGDLTAPILDRET